MLTGFNVPVFPAEDMREPQTQHILDTSSSEELVQPELNSQEIIDQTDKLEVSKPVGRGTIYRIFPM